MPRFVILEHDHPTLHWDLMLESGNVLKTWRLPAPPPQRPTTALALGDHRLDYLTYEGPVSGNRGAVKRWDHGTYATVETETSQDWTIELQGGRWRGVATLVHQQGKDWSIQFGEAAPGEHARAS